jgi:hypothetical protein
MAGVGRRENLTCAGRGRVKGVPNKTTKLAKQAIAEAAEKLGGTERLVAWAQENPDNEKVFWSSIYTKLIPVQTEITGKDGEAIQFEQKVADDAASFRSRLLSSIAAGAAGSGTGETSH